jgi:hypothetical protein
MRDKVFLLSAFLPLLYLIKRLIDESQITKVFPIDAFANDWSSHMARLFFLAKYGYHAVIPNWYAGHSILFQLYPPLWHHYALPWYYLFGNVQTAVFAAHITTYIIAAAAVVLICRQLNLSAAKTAAFFAFLFANPITIGNFLRLGKVVETFAWTIFLFLVLLIVIYKSKELDWKFYIGFVAVWSLLFYAHLLVFITSGLFVFGFLISRKKNEILGLIAAGLATLAITAPHWTNFISYFDWLSSKIVPLVFIVLLALYAWQHRREFYNKTVIFAPAAVAAALYLSGLLAKIPLLNRPNPDTYNVFFIILSLILLMSLNFKPFNKKLRAAAYLAIILLPIAGVGISHTYTSYFQPHTPEADDTLALLPDINGYFIISGQPRGVSAEAIYSYAAIYYDKNSLGGWGDDDVSADYDQRLGELYKYTREGNLKEYSKKFKSLSGKNVITYGDFCEKLTPFGFRTVKARGAACLLATDML